MEILAVHTKSDINAFITVSRQIYCGNPYYRSSNEDIVELLVRKESAFKKHAAIYPFIVKYKSQIVGRFALINDTHNKDYVMAAFFEALENIPDLAAGIVKCAQEQFSHCKKIGVGLDGHLNYGAGILLNKFDETPSYGLPYTMSYYPEYFEGFNSSRLFTFQFPINKAENFHEAALSRSKDITVRPIDRNNLLEEIKIYTALNNKCFKDHIFWTNRDYKEDYELFSSFRQLIKNENLLFAEYKGEPVGFLLWFPDFNQMLKPNQLLKVNTLLSRDVLRFKYFNPIKKIRFAEIAVVPEFQHKLVDLLMLKRMFAEAYKSGYRLCEGGFISETNQQSINLTTRYVERITGAKVEPYRTYAVFEKLL